VTYSDIFFDNDIKSIAITVRGRVVITDILQHVFLIKYPFILLWTISLRCALPSFLLFVLFKLTDVPEKKNVYNNVTKSYFSIAWQGP